MPEVLLPRAVLQSIRFDLDAHLAKVKGAYQDADFSSEIFQAKPVLNQSLLSRLLAYLSAALNDTPRIEKDENITIGVYTKDDTNEPIT